MRTFETTVYNFNELSNDAKANALDQLRDLNTNGHWWNDTYEDARNAEIKIYGFNLDYGTIEGELVFGMYDTIDYILENHGSDCETYATCKEYKEKLDNAVDTFNSGPEMDYEFEDSDVYDTLRDEFTEAILNNYLFMLKHELEYLLSDEAVIESIEANEYEFTEKGKLVKGD